MTGFSLQGNVVLKYTLNKMSYHLSFNVRPVTIGIENSVQLRRMLRFLLMGMLLSWKHQQRIKTGLHGLKCAYTIRVSVVHDLEEGEEHASLP